MTYEGYECLRIRVEDGVAFVTIDHPPINLFDMALIQEMDRVGRALADDPDVRVVVLDSANPDFFIAHADVALIQRLPRGATAKPTELGIFHVMVERFRTMPKATIAKIEGRTRGGGSELVLSFDMRFAAAWPCGTGAARGRARHHPGRQRQRSACRGSWDGAARSRSILGCDDFDADTGRSATGWVNCALPPALARPASSSSLARRIASFPAEAIALAKALGRRVPSSRPSAGLVSKRAHYFNQALATTAAERRMRWFLESGGQTPEVECDLAAMIETYEE